MKISTAYPILLTSMMASFSSNVDAAGFAIAEQSVKGLGTAFSGGAASADDAATIWYNPAGMTKFSGTQISAGLHAIFPKAEYSDTGSILNPALSGGTPTSFNGRDFHGDKNALVPNFYITHALNEKTVVGLGMNAPFGLVTDHDSDWIGRYHALRSDVATVNLNPSIAFKLNDQVSFGVGISAQYIDVKLSKSIDMSAGCLSALGAAPCAGIGLATPGNVGTDSSVRLEGHDWSFGYNLGVLFEPQPNTRFGLHYRSHIKHALSGSAEFWHPNPAAAGLAAMSGLTNQTINASVDLPENISVSGFHQLNKKWSIQGDITWTRWSRFDELRIDFATGREDITPEQWDDSWRYAIGANYYHDDKLTLRGGISFEETPITDASLRTPRIADADRIWLAIGASYEMTETLSVDLSFTHLIIDDPSIDYVKNFPNNPHAGDSSLLKGDYDASVNILSAQFNMVF